MVDIARLYHPTSSNDPRILACTQPCPKSPTAVQRALPRQAHSAAADRGSTSNRAEGSTRRRRRSRPLPGATVGQSALLRRLLDLPTVGIPHRPLARRSLVASRQPWALSVLPIRNGVVAYWVRTPSKRPSARRPPRLAGEPAHRSATRPGATAHRRTPEPLRRARHSARTARPEASAHDRTR